jgi:hypothetical protein
MSLIGYPLFVLVMFVRNQNASDICHNFNRAHTRPCQYATGECLHQHKCVVCHGGRHMYSSLTESNHYSCPTIQALLEEYAVLCRSIDIKRQDSSFVFLDQLSNYILVQSESVTQICHSGNIDSFQYIIENVLKPSNSAAPFDLAIKTRHTLTPEMERFCKNMQK